MSLTFVRMFYLLTLLLGSVFISSRFYCHCNTGNGVEQVGWNGLSRISSSPMTDFNKDRVYSFCRFICGTSCPIRSQLDQALDVAKKGFSVEFYDL